MHLDSTCPICAAMFAPGWRPFGAFTRDVRQALTLPCLCPDADHDPVVAPPHARPGCLGYGLHTQEIRDAAP
jgi:hypothetical protein